jgi:hypothetical protein
MSSFQIGLRDHISYTLTWEILPVMRLERSKAQTNR